MTAVLVPLAEGFEEIEAVTIVDVLRRADIAVSTAGLQAKVVVGSHRLAVTADVLLAEVLQQPFDAIALPGGPGTYKLRDDQRLLGMLRSHAGEGRLSAAICAAPIVLSAAGLLQGRKVTAYPSVRQELSAGEVVDAPVVVDGKIVTGSGPGTAMPFALKLVEILRGHSTADRVASAMLFK